MINWKKEAAIFVAIFFVLALGMHFQAWMTHPIAQIENLPGSPLGPWHPLYITLAVYLLVVTIRLLVAGVRRLFGKR